MGQVYYDMGFLSSNEVFECSATDLVGEYIGHTGPKTKQVFEKALGRVLFIDEAYRLSKGRFAKEAIEEVVGILTQEAYIGKIVVILAGYNHDMNKLMAVNTGLSSRFPEEIIFENMSPKHCLQVLQTELTKSDIRSPELGDEASAEYASMVQVVYALSYLPSWGNARDVKTLAKQMVRLAYKKLAGAVPDKSGIVLTGADLIACMEVMLKERHDRNANHLDPLTSPFVSIDHAPDAAPTSDAPKPEDEPPAPDSDDDEGDV